MRSTIAIMPRGRTSIDTEITVETQTVSVVPQKCSWSIEQLLPKAIPAGINPPAQRASN